MASQSVPARVNAIVYSEEEARKQESHSFTLRASIAGLFIGMIVCLANMYFGLQTGYGSTMAVPSALMGFGIFRVLHNQVKFPFSPSENVLVSTVAGAVGLMPVSAGFIGAIPAVEHLLRPEEGGEMHISLSQILAWSLGRFVFGSVFALAFRDHFINREKLPFPSAIATARVIETAHDQYAFTNTIEAHPAEAEPLLSGTQPETSIVRDQVNPTKTVVPSWMTVQFFLMVSIGSGVFTLVVYFLPILRNFPIFGTVSATWLWTINFSPGYFGQGMITGPVITLHMLAGSIVGWGILSPIAKHKNWAPGSTGDWDHGSRGWIVWVSLAILLTDCVINLVWLIVKPLLNHGTLHPQKWKITTSAKDFLSSNPLRSYFAGKVDGSLPTNTTGAVRPSNTSSPHSYAQGVQVTNFQSKEHHTSISAKRNWGVGLVLSMAIGVGLVKIAFSTSVPLFALIIAFILPLLLCLMGIRALGEADFIPAGGIAKVTILFFAFVVVQYGKQSSLIITIVAASITECAVCQAAELMFGLKVASLLSAKTSAQFAGHLIGATFGIFLSTGLYKLYSSVYTIPSDMFQIPTAYIWLSAARLGTGSEVPEKALVFAAAFSSLFAVAILIKLRFRECWWQNILPGGVAFAIGIYNPPAFILIRVIGGVLQWYCISKLKIDGVVVQVLASALILGEGLGGILTLGLAAFQVPTIG